MPGNLTTLCYIEKDGRYLMLHRTKKRNDINADKWIGVGGHFKEGESPEDCLLREVYEETGLTLTSWKLRGIVTFSAKLSKELWETEYMFLYTADRYTGTLRECSEGMLEWIEKPQVYGLPIWEGDRLFFRLLEEGRAFFSLKLCYESGVLKRAVLDGESLDVNYRILK